MAGPDRRVGGRGSSALRTWLAALAVLGLVACGGGASPGTGPAVGGSTSATGPSRSTAGATDDAADDLARWLDRLEAIHPEPFHAVSRETFVGALDELSAGLPELSPAEATVSVMRVAAMLARERDGHQFALVDEDADWPLLPIQLYELPEGPVITAAMDSYEDLVGARVVAIGGQPIDDVLAAVEPLVPRDGPATVPTFRPGFLLRTVVLRGLGIVPDEDAPVTLTVQQDQTVRDVELEPVPLADHVAWAGPFGVFRLPALAAPPYLEQLDGPMASTTYLPEHRTVVLRLTQIQPAGSVVAEARTRMLQADVDRVVLDLRQNPGGDNHNNAVVVSALVALADARPDVPIVVLTDRVTFSAASNLATDVEQATDAVFVGEAMGGGLNFWDDVTFVELDHLPVPMRVGVSTRYWQRADPDDPRLTIEPDVPVAVTWTDLAAGRDPALEAALAIR